MNEEHEKSNRALHILKTCGIDIGADFEALDPQQVGALTAHATKHQLDKYGPAPLLHPRPAPLVRSFHDLLQRRAARYTR